DARVEVAVRPRFPVELERALKIAVRHGSPVGPSHQRRKDSFGRAVVLVRTCRPSPENTAPAGRVPGAGCRIRADDRDGIDCGLDPWMPVRIEMGLVRLT